MSDAPKTVDSVTPASSERGNVVVSKRGRRLVIAIIILLLLGLGAISALLLSLVAPRGGVASSEETNGITWVRSIYGWGSTPQEQLSVPQEVFIDGGGTIWLTDTQYADRAFAFSPEGALIETVGQDSKEPMISAAPLAVSVDDRLFVGESAMDRMRVFDSSGQELGVFGLPNPIDIDARGDRMVVGSSSGFALLDPETGAPVKVVGSRGKGEGQFDTVNGVAVAGDGRIYAVDTYNNRLSAYDAEGERLWIVSTGAPANTIDVTGGAAMASSTDTTAPARLQLPSDITIDGRGRLVVVDALDFSISVFDSADGAFIAKYGDYGPQDGQFVYPSSIAYDPQRDWFAVADAGNSRVQIVRIPDSSSNNPLAAARRTLSGPLRACLVPLLLLLVLIIAYVVRSRRRKKQEALALADDSGATAAIEGEGKGTRPDSEADSGAEASSNGT